LQNKAEMLLFSCYFNRKHRTMSRILQEYNKSLLAKSEVYSNMPEFKAGDTVNIKLKVSAGLTSRVQSHEGVVIAYRNVSKSIVIRKLVAGGYFEMVIPLYSPMLIDIKVIKKGKVRRAKLYYLRKLKGKKARIKSKK